MGRLRERQHRVARAELTGADGEPAHASRALLQAPRFAKAKRRLHAKAQLAVDEAVKAIVADPLAGEPKTGALKGVRVQKFKVGPLQLLLAYQFHDRQHRIELLDVGPHENFYKALQNYLDAR